MKFAYFHFLIISLLGSAVAAGVAGYDISSSPASSDPQKSISVRTNDVVVIDTASGARAVLQFTSFDQDTAAYRWRYRAAKRQPTASGTGQVRESYERKPRADGNSDLVARADHDTTVRVGEMRIEWSCGSTTNGWLYYYPSRAKIRILGSDSFEKEE